MQNAKATTKSALSRVSLDGLWGDDTDRQFQSLQRAIVDRAKLSYPDKNKLVCLFTDASADFYARILTQIPEVDMNQPVEEQRHEALAFVSGRFVDSSRHWSVVEKEAFSIIESMRRMRYITLTVKIHIYNDHRNLKFIYDPLSVNSNLPQYVASKVVRWGVQFNEYEYMLYHLEGSRNVWSDLMTRWGASKTNLRRLAWAPIWSELDEWNAESFLTDVRKAQESMSIEENANKDVKFDHSTNLWRRGGSVLVPQKALELKVRILVVAHTGRAGHKTRGNFEEDCRFLCLG